MAIQHYWYTNQLRNYIKQFCGVFVGLNVMTGKGEDGTSEMLGVPIVVGNKDRVVAGIMAGNTQNLPFSLPMMSAQMVGLELAPERRKGVGTIDRKTFLPVGSIFPDDLAVVHRVMPVPYNASMELSMYASNTHQLHQMLEQILLMFDPVLQLQLSDAPFDWTKITDVELIGISNEENYPSGIDKRMIIWSLSFIMPIYMSAPMDLKDDLIKEINIRLGNMAGFSLDEVDTTGELQPFAEEYGPIVKVTY